MQSKKAPNNQPQKWAYNDGGKVPPQDLELEASILGACMIERDAFPLVSTFCNFDDFYKESHQLIYKAIEAVYASNDGIDLLTVTQRLRSLGYLEMCGGALYVTQMTTKVNSAANIEAYCLYLKQLSNRRKLIEVSHKLQQSAYDETIDVLKLISDSSDILFSLNSNITPTISWATQVSQTVQNIIDRMQGKAKGIPSKFTEVNKLIGGYEKQYYVKAARPAMGKSIHMVNEAVHMAKMGYRVLIFSLEMSAVMQCGRMISAESGVYANKVKRGKIDSFEFSRIRAASQSLAELPITVYDMSSLTTNQMKAICQKHKSKEGLEVVFLDYLQLVDGESDNETQAINKVSGMCRRLPKDLDCTVIAYAQLNRSVETRGGDKRPILADIKQSGNVEQDAFCVSFFWRPEYYGVKTFEDGTSTEGVIFEIFAKNRDDATGDAVYHFDGAANLMKDLPETVTRNLDF